MLSNKGNAAVGINSITFAGDFSQTNNCGTSLAGLTNCTITFVFKPNDAGTRIGNITVMAADPASPLVFALKGVGTGLKLSKTSLTFANQILNTTSPAQIV